MWKLVLVHLEVVLILRKIGARFAPNVPRAWKSFSAHPMVLRGVVSHVEARFGAFGGVLLLAQDGCTVCAECTLGMEIILGTPDGTPS